MDQQKEKGSKKGKAQTVWIVALSAVLGLALVVNVLFGVFNSYADLFLGRGTAVINTVKGAETWNSQYYTNDYADLAATEAAAAKLVESIEAEGAVLLKNDGALPLKASADSKARVTVLGRDAADPVYGGSGSGGVDVSSVVDLKTGLQNAHFEVNAAVWDVLVKYTAWKPGTEQFGPAKIYEHKKGFVWMDHPEKSSYDIGEMPAKNYGPVQSSFASYGDAAIVMFGRPGGEGGDLGRDMKGSEPNYTAGQHQLMLNKDEKDLLALAEANFKKVIVLINASTPLELGPLASDPKVNAVLWVGSPGQSGFNAIGSILNGTVNPSGRTADIYPADFTKDPTFTNFGGYQYTNINKDNSWGDGFFVRYAEGIYIGYRYYETAAKEGFIDYSQAVVYPFGYGLSYSTFDWKVTGQRLGDVKGTLAVDVEVKNTGTVAGKDVVQLYYSAPYTKGGIEKSETVLGDFAKTKVLAPGESQVLTLSIAAEDMASYDYKTAKAWVLEAGDYQLRLQTDSHNLKKGVDAIGYRVGQTVTYAGDNHRASDKSAVTNQFDDVSAQFVDQPADGKVLNFSRADFAGTFPKAPAGNDFVADEATLQGFAKWDVKANLDEKAVMPTTGAKNGLSLIDLRGKAFNDPVWHKLLDQITPEEMLPLLNDSAYKTAAVKSVNKPAAVDLDGPAGLNSWLGKKFHGMAYTSEVVIASTFNKELAHDIGVMFGNEGLALGANGWYGPAMNTHRSQFAGRNFEYYSEDGVLAGKLAAQMVAGAADKGLYAFIKHFALNDQETNRVNNAVATWANEQAIREIYLKPFEVAVKTAQSKVKYISDDKGTLTEKPVQATKAVMSSFNRIGSVWAGGRESLQTNVLRNEWGFEGFVLTDFNLYPQMVPDQGLKAGTDLNLTFAAMKPVGDTTSPTAVSRIREAAHRVFYTVANSNAMNGVVPGATVTYTMAPWLVALIVCDVVVALLLIAGFVFVVRSGRKQTA